MATLPLAALLALITSAHGATLRVGPTQAYTTVGAAVAAASSGDTVLIDPGAYAESMAVTGKTLTLEADQGRGTVTLLSTGGDDGFLLLGAGANVTLRNLIVDGQSAHRCLYVEDDATVSISQTTLRGGWAAGGGGTGACMHLKDTASAYVTASTFEQCVSDSDGGAVFARGSAVLVAQATLFDSNDAVSAGGAVACSSSSTCTFSASVFVDNTSGREGGAIEAKNDTALVSASLFAHNVAQGRGGAIAIDTDTEVVDSVFCENHSGEEGGALDVAKPAQVISSAFIGNTSVGDGAALHASDLAVIANVLAWANYGPGPVVFGATDADLRYSWFYANQLADEDAIPSIANTYGVDPMLADYRPGDCRNSDFSLAVGSPLLDAGDPDPLYDDPDGTVGDIGPYAPTFRDVLDGTLTDSDGDGDPDLTDCAPYDPSRFGGQAEVPADGIDQDCDGVDACWVDGDGDGFGIGFAPGTTTDCTGPGEATAGGDCNDQAATAFPGGVEVCDPLDIDEDCDGDADDADDSPSGQSSYYADADQDGFGTGAAVLACDPTPYQAEVDGDCDDADPAIHPYAAEVCDPLDVDEDCDGDADDADATVTGQQSYPADLDGDGFTGGATVLACDPPASLPPGDCDDTDSTVNPTAQEVCDPADVDEDCDGFADDDDDDATGTTAVFADLDGDGYGDQPTGAVACDPAAGTAIVGGDCDDTDDAVNPGATERCDVIGVDEDCDGAINDDDDDVTGGEEWFVDVDGDGHAGPTTVERCVAGPDHYPKTDDCDDTNPQVNPRAQEVCDADDVDEDCDGLADDLDDSAQGRSPQPLDNDGDGYAGAETVMACDASAALEASDCDDGNIDVHPGATEVAGDGIDQNCTGADLTITFGGGGCSCSTLPPASSGAVWLLGGVLALLLQRRRTG